MHPAAADSGSRRWTLIARQQEAVMSLLAEPLFFVTAVIVALLLTAANKTVFGQPAPQPPMIIEAVALPCFARADVPWS
jgi:hypothetical protein